MSECAENCGSISRCDIFDFMARYVGMTVIHPGGYNATSQLLNALRISKNSHAIDIAAAKEPPRCISLKSTGAK